MSAQDVETLRSLYEDWARGDYSRDDVFAPDIRLEVDDDFPDIMIEPGYAGFLSAMRMWLSSWEKPFVVEAEELVDFGDQVVAIVRWRGVSKHSGSVVERPGAHLWTMRDGKVARLKLCRDRAEAFASAAAAAAD
jgi:ketosteroid isomerase-like protein